MIQLDIWYYNWNHGWDHVKDHLLFTTKSKYFKEISCVPSVYMV